MQSQATIPALSRRNFLQATAAGISGAALLNLLACQQQPATLSRVVCYCSMDSDVAQPIFQAFTKSTGIRVDAVYDTEATKTTGLVNRLLNEKARPRADVWWGSEPFGSIRLERAGVLAPYTSPYERDFPNGWPKRLRGKRGTWYGHALRRRVCVYNTKLAPDFAKTPSVNIAELPARLPKGRLALARPQFGTTRGHLAILLATFGEPVFSAWLKTLKADDVRLLDGNAAVVRAVADGTAHAGFADADDVQGGKNNTWPVNDVTLLNALAPAPALREVYLPCTLALVQGGPNPGPAARLLETLLSAKIDTDLASSGFCTRPARLFDPTLLADLESAADVMERAMGLCEQVLGTS